MARGKRAIALFEVIQSTKEKKPNKVMSLATPSWWFKRHPQQEPGMTVTAVAETAPPRPVRQPVMRELPPLEPAEDEPLMPVEIIAPPPAIRPAPRVGVLDEAVAMQRDIVDHEEEFGAPPLALPPAVRVGVDRDKQVFRLQVTYGSAMVTAVGLLVIVVLSFIIGKAISRGPSNASASPSIEDLRKGPAFADVLKDPDSTTRTSANISDVPTPRPISNAAGNKTPVAPQAVAVNNPPTVAAEGKRIVGMQYVLIQSYPDEEDATKAVEVLRKNGIPCSIEKNLPGWGSSWYCVLGSTSFERTKNNPQFDQYVKAIRDVSAQFANSSKFKKFDPRPIGWKEKANG